MVKKIPGPKWKPINDRRYSECGSYPLEELDWSQWWMDAWHEDAWRYIHVPSLDGDSVHRVRPKLRKGQSARMGLKDGVLFWLIDRPRAKTLEEMGA